MPDNKKHHYVPRFYLKRFSSDGKSINLFNWKNDDFIASAKLKTQCYRDYFYGKNPTVEHTLGLIEGAIARLLAGMDDCLVPPSPHSEQHHLLLLHVLIKYGRTLYAAEAANEMVNNLVTHLIDPKARADGISLSGVTFGISEPANFMLSGVMQALPLCLDLDCKLIVNNTQEQFVVSDNPVALYNQLFSFRSPGGNAGLASKGLQIYFPVDPLKYIVFYDREVYQVGSRSSCVVTLNNPQDVYELNTLQMCSALENVYFRDAPAPENLSALRRKAIPFRRVRKSSFLVYPHSENDSEERELVVNSSEELRTNLKLSFICLRRSAVRLRKDFQRMKVQPAAVVRDQQLCTEYREFMEKVREGEHKANEFFDYVARKYRVDNKHGAVNDEQELG